MADTTTPVYSFVLPEVDGSDGTWGTKLNANLTALDGLLSGSTNLQNASFTGTVSFGGSTGTAGQVLKSQGAGANAIWTDDTDTTYTAGSGLSLTGTEFANTAPDQTVVLTAGASISVSGTYPSFTITNDAPDQTVALTGTGATTVTGTYPNFTIDSTDNNTTYTAGTGLTLTSTEFSVTDNGIGALQLNVSGNGTAGQVLQSDGDGTFTWTNAGTGGNETLAQTLALGAVTGGTSISVSSGDNIIMAASSTVDGRDVSVDGTKLDGIEAGATADQTASEILTAIKTVDGSGSGLDSDTVDGIQASSFLRSDATTTFNSIGNNLEIDGDGTDRIGILWKEGTQRHWEQYITATDDLKFKSITGGEFQVEGDLTVDNGQNTTVDVVSNDDGISQIRLYGSNQGTGRVFVGQTPSYGGGIEYNGDNSPVTTGSGADQITLFRVAAGTVYWTARNQYNLNDWQFRGNVTAYASDERLKDNVTTIDNALDKVSQLRGVTYDWKNDVEEKGFLPSMKHETGVIAQEVQKVIPDAVVPAPFDNEYLTVQHEKIIPVLIEAIKELKAEVEELKGAK